MRRLSFETSPVAADDYLELVKAFPLRTLRSDHEHLQAVKVLTRLLGRPDGKLSAGERVEQGAHPQAGREVQGERRGVFVMR
jgi:hypothetical protein